MIALFTDFGADGPYVGQMKAALVRHGAGAIPLIDLLHSAPRFDALAGAHLLAALGTAFDAGTIFLAVVDAGVGGARRPVAIEADGRWLVGPDNGLLSVLAARAAATRVWDIVWRPARLSASFHGRDLFAPVAAALARDDARDLLAPAAGLAVDFGAGELARIIYVDHYGNAMTGLRAASLAPDARIEVAGERIAPARVFSALPRGELFWYGNSVGLVEIAANQASAAARLGLALGDAVGVAALPG